MITKIEADVYCKTMADIEPSYQLYLDDELMIERRFLWDVHANYITEHVEADLAPGLHTLRVITRSNSKFEILFTRVNGTLINNLSFVV